MEPNKSRERDRDRRAREKEEEWVAKNREEKIKEMIEEEKKRTKNQQGTEI